jgi:hypothetical protein
VITLGLKIFLIRNMNLILNDLARNVFFVLFISVVSLLASVVEA